MRFTIPRVCAQDRATHHFGLQGRACGLHGTGQIIKAGLPFVVSTVSVNKQKGPEFVLVEKRSRLRCAEAGQRRGRLRAARATLAGQADHQRLMSLENNN